jgi:hypothetical protein
MDYTIVVLKDGKMKRIFFLMISCGALMLSTCKSTPGSGTGESEPIPTPAREYEKIEDLISGKTDFYFQIKSIRSFYRNLLVNDYSLFGVELSNEQLESLKKNAGFNPLSLKDLEEHGFDTGIPVGFGFIDFGLGLTNPTLEYENTLALFIPARDPAKVLNWLFTAMGVTAEQVEKAEGRDVFFFRGKNGHYYATRTTGNYVILAQKLNNPDTLVSEEEDLTQVKQTYIDSLIPPASLADTREYTDVKARLSIDKDLFLFINMKNFFNKITMAEEVHGPAQVFLEMFSGMLGLGYAVDYSGPDLIIDSVMNIEPDSLYAKIYSDVVIDKNIVFSLKEKPVFLVMSAFNIEALYEQLLAQLEQANLLKAEDLNDKIQQLDHMLGIDIQGGIIANFAGSANLVVSPLHNEAKLPPIAAAFNLKDPEKLQAILPKLEPILLSALAGQGGQLTRETIGGGQVTVITAKKLSVYIGIARNNLILSTDKAIYEQLAAGDPNTGFLKYVSEPDIKTHLKNDLSCMYLDFQGALELIRNIPALSRIVNDRTETGKKVLDFLGRLNYMFSYGNFDGHSLTGSFTLKTAFEKPFMQSLVEFILSLFPIDKFLVPPNIT